MITPIAHISPRGKRFPRTRDPQIAPAPDGIGLRLWMPVAWKAFSAAGEAALVRCMRLLEEFVEFVEFAGSAEFAEFLEFAGHVADRKST